MPSTNWTLHDDQTLAEYVPLEDFKGILQQRIGISPDHVALLMRDGRLVDAWNGAHFAVGGVWPRIKTLFGGRHAVRLLVADLKPFQIEGEVEGLSKDNVPLAATVAVEFQVDPEKPANILGLMKERDALTKPAVYERLLPHLKDRTFGTIFKQVDASEVRGNTQLQDKIQADIMLEVERLFGDMGLMARAVSLTWCLNDEERATIQQRRNEREQAMLESEFERKKREIERESEAKEFVLQSDFKTEKLKASTEDELRHMLLEQELGFIDAREQGVRIQELKKLNHELEVLNTERQATYTKALEDAQNEVERIEIRKKLTGLKLEIEEMEKLQGLRLTKLEEEQSLDIAAKAHDQQIKTMRELNDIDLDADERHRSIEREERVADHEMRMSEKRQDGQGDIDKLKAQANMSPDQLLAINAGLSPDVANIFTERARTEGIDAQKQEALLKEMVQLVKEGRVSSEEQARFFFEKAMQGASGTRSNPAPVEAGNSADTQTTGDTVECPGCHRQTPSSDRFCRYCGQQMRT